MQIDDLLSQPSQDALEKFRQNPGEPDAVIQATLTLAGGRVDARIQFPKRTSVIKDIDPRWAQLYSFIKNQKEEGEQLWPGLPGSGASVWKMDPKDLTIEVQDDRALRMALCCLATLLITATGVGVYFLAGTGS